MVKWISVKIVVEDNGLRCSPSCPHYDDMAVDAEETCGIYHRRVPERKRCDECREAKEL